MGLLFGPVPVGLYRLADRLSQTLLDVSAGSLQIVSFPEFSRLQDDPLGLRQSLISCIRATSILAIPLMGILAAMSALVLAAIGPSWIIAADALKILCVCSSLIAFMQLLGPVLQALGKQNLLAAVSWAQAGIWATLLVMLGFLLKDASPWRQVLGIAVGRLALLLVFAAPVFVFLLMRFCQVKPIQVATAVLPSFVATVAAVAVIRGLSMSGLLSDLVPVAAMVGAAAPAVTVAVATLFVLDIQFRKSVVEMARNFWATASQIRQLTRFGPQKSLGSQENSNTNEVLESTLTTQDEKNATAS